MKCGDSRAAAAVDPPAVLKLVSLPRLSGGEANQQRDKRGERDVRGHQDDSSATSVFQRSCAFRISSSNSRTAPRPPGRALTQCAARRVSSDASAGTAASPTRREHGDVEHVVPHVGDVLIGHPELADDSGVLGPLARGSLRHDRNPELCGPPMCRRGLACRHSPTVKPHLNVQTIAAPSRIWKVLD